MCIRDRSSGPSRASIPANRDCALTLEPTNFKNMGDQIKNGRRGSLTENVIVKGKQGHDGYPEKTNNAIHNIYILIASL